MTLAWWQAALAAYGFASFGAIVGFMGFAILKAGSDADDRAGVG